MAVDFQAKALVVLLTVIVTQVQAPPRPNETPPGYEVEVFIAFIGRGILQSKILNVIILFHFGTVASRNEHVLQLTFLRIMYHSTSNKALSVHRAQFHEGRRTESGRP